MERLTLLILFAGFLACGEGTTAVWPGPQDEGPPPLQIDYGFGPLDPGKPTDKGQDAGNPSDSGTASDAPWNDDTGSWLDWGMAPDPGSGPVCIDQDGDGFGKNCPKGPDCDDTDPMYAAKCPPCVAGDLTGCPCDAPGDVRTCFTGAPDAAGVGECRRGLSKCLNGKWEPCAGEILPTAETCDQKDNDCDGKTDEDVPGCIPPATCKDADGDGFGEGCAKGPDCDDGNPYFTTTCPNCGTAHHFGCPCANPGQIAQCFSGDPSLVGKGACKAGKVECKAGYWGPCMNEVPPVPEYCDGQDNDCDGLTDEGVLSSCGNCDPFCSLSSTGPGGDGPFAPTADNSSPGLVVTPEGWLTVSESAVNLHFIWIANSAENTVSRLDTKTGCEVGRYQVCTDPSRTAVDHKGDGIITCRGDGRVAKVSILEAFCIDKNNNGKIDTSRDANGDCKIASNEMVANDECVLWNVAPDGATIARSAGVDQDDNPWVGFWNSQHLIQFNGDTGAVLKHYNIPVHPDGLVVDDARRYVWIASRSPHSLARVHMDTGAGTYWTVPSGGAYGIVMDGFGKIWVAGWDSANSFFRFDPDTQTWSTFSAYPGAPRGLAALIKHDAAGNVIGGKIFGGHCSYGDSTNRKISVIDFATLKLEPVIDIGFAGCPVGVAIDSDGNLWTVNQSTSNATKVDTVTRQVIGTYPVGKGPYTYSDMTGAVFFKSILPQGWYRIDYQGPDLDDYTSLWYDIYWDKVWVEYAAPAGTNIQVRSRTADTLADLKTAAWSATLGPFPPSAFPVQFEDMLGPAAKGPKYLELDVILNASKDAKPVVKKIKVQYGVKPK